MLIVKSITTISPLSATSTANDAVETDVVFPRQPMRSSGSNFVDIAASNHTTKDILASLRKGGEILARCVANVVLEAPQQRIICDICYDFDLKLEAGCVSVTMLRLG